MFKQWKRLLFAAVISSSVFAASYIWYRASADNSNHYSSEKPLAYVGKIFEDIQRRPATRLLWQVVNTGEPLYNGEAIRTSEKGEVRIQFADSDRYLDLEPESLIVIKKSEGEIALDLMEGSLFVNAKVGSTEEKAPGLVLNSASGKVDLSQASASLSKGQGNSVDVQVIEGKASLKSKDGKDKELTSGSVSALGGNGPTFDRNSLKIISPLPQKPIVMEAEDLKPVTFKWQGFPPHSKVSLWLGGTRKDLKELGPVAESGKSELVVSIPFGKHFWKLVAKDDAGKIVGESAVSRSEVVARYAPTVVFPLADADVPAAKTPFDMTFKWEKTEDTKQMTLEVWEDAGLTKKLSSHTFTQEESFTLPGLKEGTYYWRMSSYFVDSDKPILGKIQKFSVKPAPQVAAEPPPKPPVVPVQVGFTMPEASFTQYFLDTPQVGLSWNADKLDQVSSWRVKLRAEGDDPAQAKVLESKENKISTPVEKSGRYIASIEALDKSGDVMGTAQSQAITVAPLPLVPAPQFLPLEGSLQASMDGRSQLEWNKVDGAKEYWLTIKKNGKELRKAKYVSNSTSLKNLLPGEYEVEISAVDQHGRNSETNPARKLIVPDKSNLRAPTLKKIKVN